MWHCRKITEITTKTLAEEFIVSIGRTPPQHRNNSPRSLRNRNRCLKVDDAVELVLVAAVNALGNLGDLVELLLGIGPMLPWEPTQHD